MQQNPLLTCLRCYFPLAIWLLTGCYSTYVIEVTDYVPPASVQQAAFSDDVYDASKAPTFDPARIDSRPENGWLVNLSAAVTRLDIDPLKPDVDRELLKLHSNYRDAITSAQSNSVSILPSVNLIDGKAKQFDDGLFAALEQHWLQAHANGISGDLNWLQKLAGSLPQDSRAAAYLAVGLQVAGIEVPATNQSAVAEFRSRFESDLLQTKPIGFYAWNESLRRCYRVGRYFQMEFENDAWITPLLQALRQDQELLAGYRQITARWARLSNSPTRISLLDLVDHPDTESLARFKHERQITSSLVSLFPPGTNRESELVRRLFPRGFSAKADIMQELVQAIRSGTIDLTPTPLSGWYDYQVYAMETLLVPKRGEESQHLLLTANYQRRSLEAFQALITKRKETHILRSESGVKAPTSAPPLKHFTPRLRLEPAVTYYLRMARSYRYLKQALREFVDEPSQQQLFGLTEHGTRGRLLFEELADMERLFYGCFALSAEDLGLAIRVNSDEQTEVESGRIDAEKWIAEFASDPDLAVDTRVIVPVAEDFRRNVMSTWGTLGVRFARLKAEYIPEAPPQVKSGDNPNWTPLTPDQLSEATYLIPVDEFASVQIPSSWILNRAEFRELCSGAANREEILKRLQNQ